MAVTKTESVKLKTASVNKVRANKKKTKVPISAFIEEAIDEKIEKLKSK